MKTVANYIEQTLVQRDPTVKKIFNQVKYDWCLGERERECSVLANIDRVSNGCKLRSLS